MRGRVTQGLVFSRNYKKLAPKSANRSVFRDLKIANEWIINGKYALEFARQNKYISTFVVGVDDCDQLIDLVSNTDIEKIMPLKYETISAIKKHRPLFLPQNWSNQQISQQLLYEYRSVFMLKAKVLYWTFCFLRQKDTLTGGLKAKCDLNLRKLMS